MSAWRAASSHCAGTREMVSTAAKMQTPRRTQRPDDEALQVALTRYAEYLLRVGIRRFEPGDLVQDTHTALLESPEWPGVGASAFDADGRLCLRVAYAKRRMLWVFLNLTRRAMYRREVLIGDGAGGDGMPAQPDSSTVDAESRSVTNQLLSILDPGESDFVAHVVIEGGGVLEAHAKTGWPPDVVGGGGLERGERARIQQHLYHRLRLALRKLRAAIERTTHTKEGVA